MQKSIKNLLKLFISGISFGVPALALAANSNLSTVQNILIAVLAFLQNIILPFLFSFAFLYFLVNMARYFVIQGASDAAHTKAKSNAIYGIAAFVFMFSLWGIVSIMLTGLNINGAPVACPEYVTAFGGTCNSTVGSTFGGGTTFSNAPTDRGSYSSSTSKYTGGTGSYTGGTGSYNGSTSTYSGGVGSYTGGTGSYTGGTGSYNGGTGSYNGTPQANNSLADLIFGSGQDAASFITNPGAPRALNSSPNIAETTTCQAGMQTLLLASKTEPAQFAYALYITPSGDARWANLTDTASTDSIGYDKDTLDTLMQQGPTRVYLVTVHPESRITGESLAMNGEGPTTADLAAMCTSGHGSNITYVTVDRSGIWTTTHNDNLCPYNATVSTQLPTIETFNDLAMLEASIRNDQLNRYLNDAVTPETAKTAMSPYSTTDFSTMSAAQIEAMAATAKSTAGITINYTIDVDSFCAGLKQ